MADKYQLVDAPSGDDAIEAALNDVKVMHMDGGQRSGDLIVTSTSKDVVRAKSFASLINSKIKLLDGVNKEQGGPPTTWALIEAAIIGDKAQFTLRPYPKAALRAMRKAAAKAERTTP